MDRKDKSICFIISLFFIGVIFTSYSFIKFNNKEITYAFFLLTVLNITIFLSYYLYLQRYVSNILNKLNMLISNIINKKEDEVFSVLNDDLLSKLQSQTIKLINILKSENEREHRTKNEIQSLISDISHQLKTPFANLKMYFDFLQNDNLSQEEKKRFTKIIEYQIEKLNFLMESMIKMSRLESSIINLKIKKTSLEDICLTAIRQVYEKAKKKDIEIKFESSIDYDAFIDERWTTESIFNILDNAVKYTDKSGEIVVSIKKYELFICIEIEDNGKGIADNEINDIFKRFYRGCNTEKVDGVGIGLYLANEIITNQKGFIRVKSELGKGSKFSVMLPSSN